MSTIMGALGTDVSPSHLVPDEAHVVQFYTSDSFLLDGLGASFGSALKAGESAVVVMTKADLKGMRKRLSAQHIDLEAAARQGRFTAPDSSEALIIFMDPTGPNRQK